MLQCYTRIFMGTWKISSTLFFWVHFSFFSSEERRQRRPFIMPLVNMNWITSFTDYRIHEIKYSCCVDRGRLFIRGTFLFLLLSEDPRRRWRRFIRFQEWYTMNNSQEENHNQNKQRLKHEKKLMFNVSSMQAIYSFWIPYFASLKTC